MNDRLLRACRREKTDTRPVWFMRQAGRYLPEYRRIREKYDLLTICRTPELAAEVAATPVEKFGLDAAIVFADLLTPLEGMGITIKLIENGGPFVDEPIKSPQDVKRLKRFEHDAVAYVCDSIRMLSGLLGDVPVIGFCGAPFTLASYLIEGRASRDLIETRRFMLTAGEAWRELMDKLTDMALEYLKMQIKAGARVVQIFDSWVGCLNPSQYTTYILPHMRRLLDQLSTHNTPIIHFTTGNPALLSAISSAGGHVISVDWRIDIGEAWRVVGYDKAIQGNLDPAILLASPATIKQAAEEILRKTADRPGHIFNLGHGIHPATPPENVKLLVGIVREFDANC